MVIAVIFAGGTGIRMNNKTKPKQFLELNGKSILIHTIENFERHKEVDAIVIVCLESWTEELYYELNQLSFKKVKWIVPGGQTGQESIYNGLKKIDEEVSDKEKLIVLINDGVRPLIDNELISENIESVRTYGNAITVLDVTETVLMLEEDQRAVMQTIERERIKLAKAPQSFYFFDIYEYHNKAIADGLVGFVDSAALMLHYEQKLHSVRCKPDNIKITTPTDYYIFKALYEARESSQVFGI